ncbi:MAG: hypothetical protein NXI32_21185, partial [bacterium]|nr:hypothetical protein [bacterium]
ILQIAALGLLLVPISSQLGKLSDAILIERAFRDQRSMSQNLHATMLTYLDKEALSAKGREGESRVGRGWDETYVDNPFLARLTSIKFDDNYFKVVPSLSKEDIEFVRSSAYDKILCQIPGPFLKLFGVSVDKTYTNSHSLGDVIYMLGAKDGFLGGFKVGSATVQSYLILGPFYLVAITIINLAIFVLVQSIAQPTPRSSFSSSTLGLLYFFPLFASMNTEGFHTYVGVLFRGIWQTMLIFALLHMLIRSLKSTLNVDSRKQTNRMRRRKLSSSG